MLFRSGIVAGEFGGDAITAIVLPSTSGPGSGTPAMRDWVSCNIGRGFSLGYDPHTITAYQSLGGGAFPAGDAIAVIANSDCTTGTCHATQLAVVDLSLMLTTVPRTSGTGLGHACLTPPLPSSVVTFVNLTP